MGFLEEIPGYAEAANAEAVNRVLAFMPAPHPIAGVPIRHLNARHLMLLVGCKNRFACGGRPMPADVAMFLWFLSPEYSTVPGMREAFVQENVKTLPFVDTVLEIYRYLDSVFQDAGGGAAREKEYVAPVSGMVDVLASEYGWTDEAILEMPLARAFQYLRKIQMRKNPKAPTFNRSDKLVGEWLQKRNAPPKIDN